MAYALRALILLIYPPVLAALIILGIRLLRTMKSGRSRADQIGPVRWFWLWFLAQVLITANFYVFLSLVPVRHFVLYGKFELSGRLYPAGYLPLAFLVGATLIGVVAAALLPRRQVGAASSDMPPN